MKRLTFEELKEFSLDKLEFIQKVAFAERDKLDQFLTDIDYHINN
tara:strand:+ start:67 stop:201 length:135 start_codon:yes stop_codon:yes gene_type:complete